MKKKPYSNGVLVLAFLMFIIGLFATSWLAPMLSSIFLVLVAIYLLIFTHFYDKRG